MVKAKPAINQFLGVCSYGDAIGNMALEQQNLLRKTGFQSDIFAVNIHPRLTSLIRPLREYKKQRTNSDIIIYHLSIGSEVSEYLYNLPNRLILYYHNITPPHFFREFHDVLMLQCSLGRKELKSFRKRTSLAIADSDFNRMELESYGFSPTCTVPVPLNLDITERKGSETIKRIYKDGRTNILFVGRIIPNKKIEDVIRLFHLYRCQYDNDSRLLIIGSHRGFEKYLYYLRSIAHGLGCIDGIVFAGHVTDEDLAAYYKVADMFVMFSEHEGFCVPLLEAFASGIPVIGYDAGATGSTMRGGGILLSNKNYSLTASIMDRLMKSDDFRENVILSQKHTLDEHKRSVVENNIITALNKII